MKYKRNKHIKWRIVLFIVLFTVIILSGCSQGEKINNAGADVDNDKEVITVTDCIGRQVKVPADVNRIACLYAFTGYVTTMLGRGEDIVAINNGLSRDVLLNTVCPGIGDNLIPYIHRSINIEELVKTDPDIVFIKGDTGRNKAEVEKLEKFNLPYVVIEFNNIQEQQQAILVIGQALGEDEKAQRYNEYYQDCIERVQSRVNDISDQDKIRLYHAVNEATRTDTRDSLSADWTKRIGVINVSVGEPLRLIDGSNYASLEQILLWNPDVIIVNESGVADYILSNSQWAPLNAVKEKKVYQMPIGISRWGHPGGIETPLGLLWTAKTVYPERFKDLDIRDEAQNYYRKFFNYQVSDEMLDMILTGKDMRKAKGAEG